MIMMTTNIKFQMLSICIVFMISVLICDICMHTRGLIVHNYQGSYMYILEIRIRSVSLAHEHSVGVVW